LGAKIWACDEPVEQHADRRQVVDVGRHVRRLDVGNATDSVPIAPGE
jgi:hypothetical protein